MNLALRALKRKVPTNKIRYLQHPEINFLHPFDILYFFSRNIKQNPAEFIDFFCQEKSCYFRDFTLAQGVKVPTLLV